MPTNPNSLGESPQPTAKRSGNKTSFLTEGRLQTKGKQEPIVRVSTTGKGGGFYQKPGHAGGYYGKLTLNRQG